MENRRFLLAILLSGIVVIGWSYVVRTLRPPPELTESPPGEQPAERGPLSGEAEPGTPSPSGPPSGAAGDLITPDEQPGAVTEAVDEEDESLIEFAAETVSALEESRAVLETDEARLEITNRGGQLVSYQLKSHTTHSGEPLELVRPRGKDPYPFALVVDGDKSHRLNNALFEVRKVEEPDGSESLRLQHRSERGAAEKVFHLTPAGLLDVEITVLGTRDWGVVFGPGVRKLESGEASNRFVARTAAYRRSNGESEQLAPQKVKEDVFVSGSWLDWVSLEDNFFLSAVIPRQGLGEVLIRPVQQRAEVDPETPRFLPLDVEIDEEDLSRELLVILQSSGARMELETFFGAKQYRRLQGFPNHLDETVRWGFFGVVARPLYYALGWIHDRIVPNYGWAIVLVTVLIKLIFFPLTFKSQDSMAKMQELNPKIQAIKAKYRGKLKDRQGRPNLEAHRAMQEEQSKLLRDAGVNPMASCLPLLLQMPVFFAFYQMLSIAVELRGAPWLGWIQDLSTKDPYYVLPLLMGVTSVLMQRMMPSAADPMQRRIIQMMPIMFTIFALTFPSGLVLYWVTNNLLSMLQQAIMLKWKAKKNEAPPRREAKSEA